MGIHGLMSYVGEHNEFFLDLKLRNTKVIIDGNNLYHRLYFDSNLDIRRGGDYDSFTDITHKFFETLTVCSIQAYVVLDGGCDASDKKLTTLKERAQEKIRSAHSLSRGGGGCVLPLLIREVFKQILTQLQVPFVQSFSEADRDIVSFANHLNGLVLTLDSDFCIFDLRAGYCPLNYFQWRNLCTHKDSQDCYIPARCFSLERFCNHFSNMNKTLLPLFAVMSGNDYINLPAMEMFFSKVIYRLLLNISQCSLSTSLNKPPVSSIFHEFDRSQLSLKKSFVQAAALPGNVCNDQYSLVMLNEVALADRLTLLLEALSVTGSILEPIPRLLWLPVAVTCYWAQHSEPKVKLHHMKALLLGFVYGELHSVLHNPDPEIPAAEVNTIVYNQFLNWKQKKLQKEVLDLDTAHVFCQWQCCLQVGLYLNQLLSSPLPEPDLTRLYNGTLVHRLCRELKSTSTPENILSASPKMYQLYCNMVHIVKDSIPPNFFQKKKSKKRKNQALAKKEGATVEALPLCSVNNRFAAFMVED
ncbi:protein asteroid homolog 1 isoform X2 [Hemicordylus capensis]|uniref:protein asteroid homolog 1 isoform X2 n=1 Tax=Hemicordylus capensis TaxID=884348 RepID=UPI002303B4C3|nr:protein asteroid homolog 1 isoform X2 [Hemicordylus capensis]